MQVLVALLVDPLLIQKMMMSPRLCNVILIVLSQISSSIFKWSINLPYLPLTVMK